MISDGSDVTLREGETEHTACNCCGKPTTVVNGYLEVGERSVGWYSVGVTLDAPNHRPLCRLYIGDWSQSAGPRERWGVRIGISSDGPLLLDWSPAEDAEARPVFTPLNRSQIEGTPMEPQFWTLIDLILKHDSRL
ncbi:MAG: hypothetical protein ACU0CC_02910 [Sagittula sp.]|jgi:hypothetical protein|uniref:hypothetical protein n=1 Tax=unclassified Sagittula TaxID=2624628 RepID=UPI000C2CFDEC|nr:hypothetical protein [Sagittula sp. P11]AUC52022.1 hypothetical protein CDO87_01910 [Sagittula sp. P11]